MASFASEMDINAGTVKSEDTWGWVKELDEGSSAFAHNATRLGSVIDNVGTAITAIFGGSRSQSKTENKSDVSALLPLLALGGGLVLLLK